MLPVMAAAALQHCGLGRGSRPGGAAPDLAVLRCGGLLHPGAARAMWDHLPGPGAACESGQLPGIVCRVWEQMCCGSGISAHTAVGGYAASGAVPLLLPLSRGEAGCAPGSLPVEVGAGHLFYFVFVTRFLTALCIQNIKLQLVFVCQRC